MEAITITSVVEMTWTKYAKYRVVLNLLDRPQRVCWLTLKQGERLKEDFHGEDFSTKNREVIGIFDGDRFVWAAAITPRKSKDPFVEEKFGVKISPAYVQVFDDAPVIVED